MIFCDVYSYFLQVFTVCIFTTKVLHNSTHTTFLWVEGDGGPLGGEAHNIPRPEVVPASWEKVFKNPIGPFNPDKRIRQGLENWVSAIDLNIFYVLWLFFKELITKQWQRTCFALNWPKLAWCKDRWNVNTSHVRCTSSSVLIFCCFCLYNVHINECTFDIL